MYKALFRTPFQHAMLVLWLFGLVRLLGSLAHAPPDGTWVMTAALASLLLLLIGARHRILVVLPVATILGLGAVVAAGHALGVEYPARLGALVAVSGLALWRLVLNVQTWTRLGQFVDVLGLGGGYRAPGGCWWVETYVYWSCLALVLFGFGVDLSKDLHPGALSGVSWPVLLAASVFLIVSGYHYRRALNTYLFVVVACFAALSVLLALRGLIPGATGKALRLDDLSLGLVLAYVSASALAVALLCHRDKGDLGPATPRLEVLYGRPLRHCSAGLALLVLLQILIVAWVAPVPGWMTATNLIAASAILFWVNRYLLRPVLTGVAALAATFGILWLASLIPWGRPPTGMWPGGGARAEPWLVLAALTPCLAAAGYWFEKSSRWRDAYGIPLLWVTGLVYGWCLAGAVSLYPTSSAYLPWIIAVLIGALFPLLQPLRSAVALRGISVALLLTFLVASIIGFEGRGEWGVRAALAWGFALWGLGTFVLPRLNPILREWGVAPQSWPWLGLVVLFCGLGFAYQPGEVHWGLSLCAAVYSFLMLRHSRWPVFPWLGVVALTLGVVLLGIEYLLLNFTGSELEAIGLLAFQNLLWANALLACLPLWRRHGAAISHTLGWIDPSLRGPLLCTALVVCVAWLLGLLLWDGLLIFPGSGLTSEGVPGILLGGLLCLSLLHVHANWARGLSAHLLTAALVATVISAWAVWQPFHLPLAVVIVGAMLAAGWSLTPSTGAAPLRTLRTALGLWMRIVPAAGIGCLLLMFEIPLSEQLTAVGLLAGTAAFTGWREQSRLWLIVAIAFAALLLHGVWLLWVPWRDAAGLLPVYALQFALIGGGLCGLTLIGARAGAGSCGRWLGQPFVKQLLRDLTHAATALGTVEWGLHLLVSVLRMVADLPNWGTGGWMSAAAALAAGLVLAIIATLQAVRSRRERYWYQATALLGLTAIYGRILWVGLAPLSVWDTGAVIVAAYAMFALQALTHSRAACHLNMALPLVALVTVPLQLNSTGATLSLFAIGALYLLTCRTSGRITPLYLGLLAINAGIYLWLPNWAQQFGLLQVYVIPAALSVLFLVHLHRAELRSNVVNGARLAALSTIFGTAALDVFLQESLGIFVLALALSLAGVVVGIVTRTRAFLYAGLAFLVINVLGQLLQLYPEQRLGRALLLMLLGAAITAAMIWFNLKREAIMERLRLIRADLSTWE